MRSLLILSANILFGWNCVAAEPILDLGGKTLEDLLNIKTAVATKKPSNTRSAAAAVTIITEEEIRNLGARDLIDVLRLVPSLQFAADTQGVVGLGVRGLWAQEGKYLLLIDGIEMNEIQYAGFQFGNEFPVRQIKRIEVIRGPGSVIYGGFAELAVINIITRRGSDIQGAKVEVLHGQMTKGSGRNNLAIEAGQTLGKWDISVAGFVGRAKRGEGVYSGYHVDEDTGAETTGSFDFKDADTMTPTYFNIGASRKECRIRFIYDNYKLKNRTGYDYTGLDVNIPNNFTTYAFLANYDFRPAPKFKVTPQVTYSYQTPWQQLTEEAKETSSRFDIRSSRLKAGLMASYDISKTINAMAGFEHTADEHKVKVWEDTEGPITFNTGKNSASFSSESAIAQLIWNTHLVNVTAGVRYEDPDFTRNSFVPRLGLTRAFKSWHYKLLYSQAFRTPVLFNINARPGIRPEKTETYEGEIGRAVGDRGYLTLNLFDTKIKDPIVYYYDDGNDQYDNFSKMGSQGVELDYRWKPEWGHLQIGYSFYQANHSGVENYAVLGKKDLFLSMPQHKLVLNSWVNLGRPDLRLNPNFVYMSESYGFEYLPSEGAMAIHKTPSRALASLYLQRENIFTPGLSAGTGVFNIFNQGVRYSQAYAGGNSSLPGPSREMVVRVEYKRDF